MAQGRLAEVIAAAGYDPDNLAVSHDDLAAIRTVGSVGGLYEHLPPDRAAALRADLARFAAADARSLRSIGSLAID